MPTNIQKLLSIVSPSTGKGIRAFHGSRANFDKFDDSFIGTGYGRNFGAGHYFSTDPTIAAGYRQRQTTPISVQVGEGSFKYGYPEDGTDFLLRQYHDNLERMGFPEGVDVPQSILEREQIRESLMQEIAYDHRKAKLFRALPPEGQRKMILGILDDRIIRAERTATDSEALVALRDELSKPGTVISEYKPSKDSMHEVELDLGPYGTTEHGATTLLEYPSMGPQPRKVMEILEGIPSEELQRAIRERGYDIPGHEVRTALEGDAYEALKKKHQKELDEIDGDEFDKEQFLDFRYGGYNTAQEQAAKQLGDAGIPASAHTDGMGIKGRSINYVIHPGQTDRIRQLTKYAVPGAVAAGAAGQAEAGETEGESMAEQQTPPYLTQQTPRFAYIQAINDFVDNQTVSQQAVDEAFPPNEMRFQQVREMLGPNPTYSQFLPAVAAAENLKGSTYFSYLFPSAFTVARNELASGIISQDNKALGSIKDLAARHFNGDLSLPAGRSEAENKELVARGLDPATTLTPAGRENHMHLRGIELIDAGESQQGLTSMGGVTAFGGLSPEEQINFQLDQAVKRYARANIPGTMNPDMFQTVTPSGEPRFLRYSSPINIYNNQQGNNLLGQGQKFLQSFSNVFRDQDIKAGSGMPITEIARLRRIGKGLSQEPTPVLPGSMTPEEGQQAARDYRELEERDEDTLANDMYLATQKVLDQQLGAEPDGTRPFAGKNRTLASDSVKGVADIGKNSLFDIQNAVMPLVAAPFGAAYGALRGTGMLKGGIGAALSTLYSPKDDTVVDAIISPTVTGAASAIGGSGYYTPPDLTAIEPRSGLTTQDENFDEGVTEGDAKVRSDYIRQLRNFQKYSPKPSPREPMPDQSVYYQ